MSTLVQRSVLDASGFPLDQIQILGIAARGFHGVLESEREAGQDFSADVTLYLDTRAAARDDDLDETVNYALVAQDVVDILSGEPVDLIETVAEQIAAAVLDRPLVASVDVTVHKPQAPIPVPFSDVTVTINRDRLNVPVVTSPVAPALDELPAEDLAEPRADLLSEEPRDADEQASAGVPVPAAALPAAALPAVSFPSAGLAGAQVSSDGIPVAGSALPPAAGPAELPEAFEPVALRVDETESDVATPTPSSSPTLDLPLGQLTAPVAARESDPASYSTSELHLESDLVHDETDTTDTTDTTGAADESDAAGDDLLPGAGGQTAVAAAAVPPVDDSLLEEQARLSEQARRPEVFGLRPRTDAHLRPTADDTDDALPAQGDNHEQAASVASEAGRAETRVVEPETTEPQTTGPDAVVPGSAVPATAGLATAATATTAPDDAAPETAAPETAAPETAEPGSGAVAHGSADRQADESDALSVATPVVTPAASPAAADEDESTEDSPSAGPPMGAAFFAAASAAVLNASRDRTPLSFEELLNPSAAGDQPAAPAAASSTPADEAHPTTTGVTAAPAAEPADVLSPAAEAEAADTAEPEVDRSEDERPTASAPVQAPGADSPEQPADQPQAHETTTDGHVTPARAEPTEDAPVWQPSSFAFPPTGLSTPTEQSAPAAQAGHPETGQQTATADDDTSRFAPPAAHQPHDALETDDTLESDPPLETHDPVDAVPTLGAPDESALETTALLPPLDLDDESRTDPRVEDSGREVSGLGQTSPEDPAPGTFPAGSDPVDETQLVPTYAPAPDADETQVVETRSEPLLGDDVPEDAAHHGGEPDDETHDDAAHDDAAHDDAVHDDGAHDDAGHDDAVSAHAAHVDEAHDDEARDDAVSDLTAEHEGGQPSEVAAVAVPAAAAEPALRPDVLEDPDAPTSPVPVTDPSGVDEAPVTTPASGSAAVAAPAIASPAFGAPALADGAERRGDTPLQLDRMDARPDGPVDVVLALGANLGDAQGTLRRAVAELDTLTGVDVVEVGPLARTAAVGGPEQPDFLNTVVIVRTTLSPRELLHGCQSVEAGNGRERDVRWGPRTLDIDIVVFGDVIGSATDLELPHPRANERAFVLAPWAHLAPEAHLPGLGGGPVAALAATAHDREGIRWLALDWLHDAELPTAAQTSRPAAVAPALTAVQVVSLPDGEPAEEPTTTTQVPAGSTEPSAAPAAGDQQPSAALPEATVAADHDVSHQETTAVETAQVWTPDVEPPRAETHLDGAEHGESPDDSVDGVPAVEDRPL